MQSRKTNAFLTRDAKWAWEADSARQFHDTMEAVRFCIDRHLGETDMVVSVEDESEPVRVPLI